MSLVSVTLSIILMIVFLGWGVYVLRVKYRGHEDLTRRTEAITLGAVAVFVVVEYFLLKPSLVNSPILFTFTILGIAVATAALYGPLLVSLASQVVVDVMMPPLEPTNDAPQFGPIEALERMGDYESALHECMVVARIFPKDPSVALRIAENLANLERHVEAAEWFERGLVRVTEPDRALRIANRLVDLYAQRMERRDDARRVLTEFVERFPEHERVESIRARIARLSAPAAVQLETVPDLSLE